MSSDHLPCPDVDRYVVTGAIQPQYAQLIHDSRLDLSGSSLERTAVRGVLWRDSRMLLIRSKDGDYGFPGGGVQPTETLQDEIDLGLTPVWMDPAAALQANEAVLAERDVMHWVVRETLALRLLGASEGLAT